MNIISIIKGIIKHPLNKKNKLAAITRFIQWQLRSRITRKPMMYQFTEKSKLIIKSGMAGATGNLYCGLHEFEDMSFLLHFLREEDLFIDIGANIGSYTLLASGQVGCTAIAIEPVPSTYTLLENNITLNNLQTNVTTMNIALGGEDGTISFTSALDTTNHVATKNEKDTIQVPMSRLDAITLNKMPTLLKIDVEGFETEVIKGSKETLQKETLKAIIIELNGSGDRYGYNEVDIHNIFLSLGYKPFLYSPFERTLKEVNNFGRHNTIYIKDYNFVLKRIQTAPNIVIRNQAY
jgi:FkbM family methyltransferase